MVSTKQVDTVKGAVRLLHQASRELDQADVRFCSKYHKTLRLLAILADTICARVYNDNEVAWQAHVAAMRAEQDRRDEND